MFKQLIFLVLIVLASCNKQANTITDYTGNYKGVIYSHTVGSSDTFEMVINVTGAGKADELNMQILSYTAVAKVVKDSFTIAPSPISEFDGGNGFFSGDTMHIVYNTHAGSYNYLNLGALVKER